MSVTVEVRNHLTHELITLHAVGSVAALRRLAAEAWVTLELGDGARSFRVQGYEWGRAENPVLWVRP